MDQRELGSSGVEVSTVGFGAWVVGTDWWGERSREEAVEMVNYAIDEGVTYIDTGDVYGHGDSEELIGEAIAGRRDEVTLATKVGYDFYNNPQAGHGELPKDLSPAYIETAVERSLERLDVEHIDFLQLHNANVDEVTPEVIDALEGLRERGVVDALGWALGPSIGWLAEGERAVELDAFDAVQTVFNLFEQTPGRHFIEEIERTGSDTSVLARVPHSSGLLNEQVTPDTELGEGDHRSHRPTEWFETGWEKMDEIRFLERAERRSGDRATEPRDADGERTMGQAAIQFLLYHDAVASVTPTFRTREDIEEWAGARETPPLSESEYQRVQALYEENFGIERDDGMDPANFRTSVGGEDLERAGVLPASGD